jgi:hypothetical protein
MGQKHVKFQNIILAPLSSEVFVKTRKEHEENEYPKNPVNNFDIIESEDSTPYPSSLSEFFEDSDEFPRRKVKIKKNYQMKSRKSNLDFKVRVKQFERNEYDLAKKFKENHVKFDSNIVEFVSNSEFYMKVKKLEKNESRKCLLNKIKKIHYRSVTNSSEHSWNSTISKYYSMKSSPKLSESSYLCSLANE